MSINFTTTKERYDVTKWQLLKGTEKITDIAQVNTGDEVKFNVAFVNLKIDKECVLFIRAYKGNEPLAIKAQEVTIFPDVMPFDLTSEAFLVPDGVDRIELALFKEFESVTEEEEDKFLLGKNIHGVKPAELNTHPENFERVIELPSEKPAPYIGDYNPCQEFFKGTICFVQESSSLWIKNAKYRAKEITIRKDKKLWIPLDTAKKLFERNFNHEDGFIEIESLAKQLGAYSYTNRFGLGVISDLPYDYTETKYQKLGQYMVRFIEYERPKAAQLKEMFKKRVRPRSLGTRKDIERVLKLSKTDKRAMWLSEKIIEFADRVMKAPVQYKLDRAKEQACFITAIVDYDDIMALYWAYLAKGDRKYLDRLKEHVLAMAGLEHWCGDFFALMTSRALVTLSMAYDFLYDEFTPDEREKMAKAMVEKGFKPTLELYYGRGKEEDWPWVIRRTNWNFIPNSGMIFAACTLFGEYETDICADILEKAIQSLEFACIYLAPDGELFEGLGYAAYSWNYLVFAFNALEANFGTTFHLADSAGCHESYKIPYKLMSKTGTYTAGDGGSSLNLNTMYTMWWARRLNDHNVQTMRHMQIREPGGNLPRFSDMLWFDEEGLDVAEFEKDTFYENTQSAISRSDWGEDSRVLFLHGGDNTMEHGHMDLGNFEFELGGFRFAHEIGMDSVIYCAAGSKYMHKERNEYYAARAEGHNVYVINPDRSPGQSTIGSVFIKTLELSGDKARYEIDLESAYRGQVKSATRFCELIEGRKVFRVQDEIVPQKSGDKFYWLWHTFAHIAFPKDVKAVEVKDNRVVLTAPDGRKVNLQIDVNVDFVLRKGMSLPMETSPAPFDQLQGGIISNMLTVYFESTDKPVIVRVYAWEDGFDFTPGELAPYER